MGNFVEPLSDIAVKLLSHLESIGDESGVQDIRPELHKWAFQGTVSLILDCIRIIGLVPAADG